jgi:hypothetical protein
MLNNKRGLVEVGMASSTLFVAGSCVLHLLI